MAISLYFGLPGCGKTTMLAKLAYDAVRKGKYENVYTNVFLNIPGVTYIDNDCIGKYALENSLVLIDEATLFADSRAYKTFDKGKLEFFLLHRHYKTDICLFTQQWDGVDRKIRVITDRVFYIYKGVFTRHWFSKCYQIPYGIIIPDPKKGSEKLGEIIQGYARPPWYVRIFAKVIYRPKYYPFFDSWALDPLPALPAKYEPIQTDYYTKPFAFRWAVGSRKLWKKYKKQRRKDRYERVKKFLWRW